LRLAFGFVLGLDTTDRGAAALEVRRCVFGL
jgi:hypothetical protein